MWRFLFMNDYNVVFNAAAKATVSDFASSCYSDSISSNCNADIWVGTTSITDLADRVDKLEQETKKPDVDPSTKTELVSKNGCIYIKHYKDGFFQHERKLMADIVDVRVYDNTVVVIFSDKTKTSAVLDSVDTFSVEQGISVCVTKKLLGDDGSSIYNKLITRALKVIKHKEKAAEDAAKKKENDKKARELKKSRAERRKAKRREESISVQAEAIKRAFAGIIENIKN
jgi:hypothetical protein